MIKVLFVCLGNICRSPLAEGLFRHHVMAHGLSDVIAIDSAGTGAWHIGNPPDPRSIQTALGHGIDIGGQRARKVTTSDFDDFDYIIAMDHNNFLDLNTMKPPHGTADIQLLLSYDPEQPLSEVPDPYYGGDGGFAEVYTMVDQATEKFLAKLKDQHFR